MLFVSSINNKPNYKICDRGALERADNKIKRPRKLLYTARKFNISSHFSDGTKLNYFALQIYGFTSGSPIEFSSISFYEQINIFIKQATKLKS